MGQDQNTANSRYTGSGSQVHLKTSRAELQRNRDRQSDNSGAADRARSAGTGQSAGGGSRVRRQAASGSSRQQTAGDGRARRQSVSGSGRQQTAGDGRTRRQSASGGVRKQGMTARQMRERQERRRQQRIRQRRRRILLIASICAIVAVIVIGVSVSSARKQRAAAAQAAAEAEAQRAQAAAEAEAKAREQAEAEAKAKEEAEAAKPKFVSVEEAVKVGPAMTDEEVAEQVKALEAAGVSSELITLFRSNDEARKFVMDYDSIRELTPDRNISAEVKKGTVPHFIQWDERWGCGFYGDDVMALTGCGPTCLSMVYSGLTGRTDMDPLTLAEKADQEGYYVPGTGSSWELMENFAREIGLESEEVVTGADSILEELREGHPLICAVGEGDFTVKGHFIVLADINEDGSVKVYDPNSYRLSQQSWDIYDILDQTRDLWRFSFDPDEEAQFE